MSIFTSGKILFDSENLAYLVTILGELRNGQILITPGNYFVPIRIGISRAFYLPPRKKLEKNLNSNASSFLGFIKVYNLKHTKHFPAFLAVISMDIR